jgi:uncharacterized RDD family membrane protein YckC
MPSSPPPPGPGPFGNDPGFTQATPIIIPGVTPGTSGLPPNMPPPNAARQAVAPGVPYDHRQGSWASHLFARLCAFIVDIVGVGFVLAAFGFDLVDHGSLALAPRHDQNGWLVLVLLSLGCAVVFAFLCEAIIGTTLGKALFMLHVRRFDGKRAGFGRALPRYLLLPLDLLAIGPILAAVTPKRRRLGDLAGGTVVGRSPIGPLATALAAILLALLAYAQAAYGGGFTSALGVSAETATYLPAFVGGFWRDVQHTLGRDGSRIPAPFENATAAPIASPGVNTGPDGTATPSASRSSEP